VAAREAAAVPRVNCSALASWRQDGEAVFAGRSARRRHVSYVTAEDSPVHDGRRAELPADFRCNYDAFRQAIGVRRQAEGKTEDGRVGFFPSA
jgi:hypothetical protein